MLTLTTSSVVGLPVWPIDYPSFSEDRLSGISAEISLPHKAAIGAERLKIAAVILTLRDNARQTKIPTVCCDSIDHAEPAYQSIPKQN